MKTILLLCLITQSLWAQTLSVQSKIENVTVFLSGAQINRSAKISLPAGKTDLSFKGISPQISKQSIQVKSEVQFTILSVTHQLSNNSDRAEQEKASKIEIQKQQLEDKIIAEKNNLLLFKREEDMLLKNQVVGGSQSGIKVADLKESIEYHRQRMQEVLSKKTEFEKNIQKLETEVKKLNQLLTEINIRKDTPMSEITVSVLCKTPLNNIPVSISYFVEKAGWKPTYDFRIEKLNQPVNLSYKATIFQYSGEDWPEVKLALSTANPFKSGTAPVLQKWVLGKKNDYSTYYNTLLYDNTQTINDNQSEVWGQLTEKHNKQPIPGVSVNLKGTPLGTTTDVNGNYRLTIPPTFYGKKITLVFSSVGFIPVEKSISSGQTNVVLDVDTEALSEVVVAGYAIGQKLSGRVSGVSISDADFNKRNTSLDISEREAPTSQLFEILMPYSIPSDGKVYTAQIKEESIPAIFEHFCIPKIDTDVFLHAHITNWEKYKLLEGEANLFVENTYLGKSTLNLSNKDTLSLSFGRDKNIIVSRNKLKSYQKKQLIGLNKTEQFVFEITARNTKNESINLLIEDQYPTSNNKEISIEGKEAPEAEVNTETGKIRWKLSLAPAKEQKVSLKYTLKMPKSVELMNNTDQ